MRQAGAEVTLPGDSERVRQGIGFVVVERCSVPRMQCKRQKLSKPPALVLIITEYLVLEIWNKL